MSADAAEAPLGYHDRMGLLEEELATHLIEHGLEATLEKAQVEAVNFGNDYLSLMRGAATKLIETHDPAAQEHSLAFWTWKAENLPTLNDGLNIIYMAKDYGNYVESKQEKAFLRRLCEIGVLHYKLSMQAEGFRPDDSFFDEFNSALAYLEEGDHLELRIPMLEEVAGFAITAALNHMPSTEESQLGREYRKYEIDNTLGYLATILRKSDPVFANLAKSLITDESELMLINMISKKGSPLDKFSDMDLDSVRQLLRGKSFELHTNLWDPMLELIVEGDEADIVNASRIIDTVREAVPDYFSSPKKLDKTFGRDIGLIIGALGHTNALDDCIGPNRKPTDSYLTAGGIAYGMGLRSNNEGFAYLMTRISHYSENFKALIITNFGSGLAEAENPEHEN